MEHLLHLLYGVDAPAFSNGNGVTWSYLHAPVVRRAAALMTDCSRSTSRVGRPASTTLQQSSFDRIYDECGNDRRIQRVCLGTTKQELTSCDKQTSEWVSIDTSEYCRVYTKVSDCRRNSIHRDSIDDHRRFNGKLALPPETPYPWQRTTKDAILLNDCCIKLKTYTSLPSVHITHCMLHNQGQLFFVTWLCYCLM